MFPDGDGEKAIVRQKINKPCREGEREREREREKPSSEPTPQQQYRGGSKAIFESEDTQQTPRSMPSNDSNENWGVK